MKDSMEADMDRIDSPDDGDFSRLLEQTLPLQARPSLSAALSGMHPGVGALLSEIVDVTPEFTQEIAELRDVPPLSDEELERQALADGRAEDYVEEEAEQPAGVSQEEEKIETGILPFDHSSVGSVVLEVEPLRGELEEEIAAMQELPLSEEELERQALAARSAEDDFGPALPFLSCPCRRKS
jgi:hypothetical protein